MKESDTNLRPLTRQFLCLGMALDIIIFDQLSKWAMTEHIIRPEAGAGKPLGLVEWYAQTPDKLAYVEIPVWSFFNIVMVWNRGVSFGMLNQETQWGPALLTGFALAISAVFLVWLFRTTSWVAGTGIALVIGGALGNVIDRVRFGAVIDFLDFHAAGYHWPAFNLADSCIVIGIGLLIIYTLFLEKDSHA